MKSGNVSRASSRRSSRSSASRAQRSDAATILTQSPTSQVIPAGSTGCSRDSRTRATSTSSSMLDSWADVAEPLDENSDLRALLQTLSLKARDTLRRVLIHDQAASSVLRSAGNESPRGRDKTTRRKCHDGTVEATAGVGVASRDRRGVAPATDARAVQGAAQ